MKSSLYMDDLDFTTYTGHLSPPMLYWYNIRHLLVTVTEWHTCNYILSFLSSGLFYCWTCTRYTFCISSVRPITGIKFIPFIARVRNYIVPMCSVYKFFHRNVTTNCTIVYVYIVQCSTVPQNCKFNSQLYNICNYFIEWKNKHTLYRTRAELKCLDTVYSVSR